MEIEVNALKRELALLKLQFSERINSVESRLGELEQRHQSPSATDNNEIQSQKIAPLQSTIAPKVVEKASVSPVVNVEHKPATKVSLPAKPSLIMVMLQAFLSMVFEWFTPLRKLYQSYQERGMVGIFILTIVGIGLTLAGFGYLMQLLIDQLGAGSKSLLMGAVALLVLMGGIGLKLKTRFGEFSSAIVTLGVLLCYSTVYFCGSVYGIMPGIVMLCCYLLIALVCHVLALWLETKVVSSLGIIGIALMPVLSGTVQQESFYYLISLAFVLMSSLILAYRFVGQWLANLAMAFSFVALEWTIGAESVGITAWIVNVFYLLVFGYITMSLYAKKGVEKKLLVLLAALIGSAVVLAFQASNLFSAQMDIVFAINALLAASIAIVFHRLKHRAMNMMILLSAMWTVLAIISAISNLYWGIAWAVEGLLLLYVGRRYQVPFVIHQGQCLMAIAILYSWGGVAINFPTPALSSLEGWILCLVIVAIIAIWQRLISDSNAFDSFTKNKIKPLLQLVEALWLSILIVASACLWIGHWTGVAVILLQFGLLFRAKQCKQISIEILAAGLIFVPLVFISLAAIEAGSFRVTSLPLYAKTAVAVAFVQLWLWSEFYRRFQPDSKLKRISESIRILFYLALPVLWLASAARRLDENILMILWASPLIALLLAAKIKHKALDIEAKILTVGASIGLIGLTAAMDLMYLLISLVGFIAFFALAFYLDKKRADSALYQFICGCGVITLGLAIPLAIAINGSWLFGALGAAALWALYFVLIDRLAYFKRIEDLIVVAIAMLVMSCWLLTLIDSWYVIVPILFGCSVFYQRNTGLKTSKVGQSLGANTGLFIHSVMLITYVALLVSLAQYRMDLLIAPVLAIHGALILFLKDKRIVTVKYSFGLILLGISKLALVDASNALLWQKVVLFMGIGVFILMASFWYQKLIKQPNPDIS